MRGTQVAALTLLTAASGLVGCAGNRAALAPISPTGGPCSASLSAPRAAPPPSSGPVTARTLAERNGLGYQDAGSFVLLSNSSNFVRLYPGSNRISVDGQQMVLRGQIVRDGRTIIVPGPAASMIEASLRRDRGHIAALQEAGRVREPVADPITPIRMPAEMPVTAPAPGPSRARGDSAWSRISGAERSWKWIVIHHSDDTSGCAAKYNAEHLAKGWENGLGYHFVIGNGTQSGDGEVEVGPRWTTQIQGAHAKTPDNCYNEQGIGICLVGDFEHGTGRPTRAQMEALSRLCRWLMERYSISSDRVMGHADCKPTACPGRNFPWSDLRRRLAGM